MTYKNERSSSPLFRIRKLLMTLRWLLGFPLTVTNNEFNEFVFKPGLEYARYALYLVFGCVIFGYSIYTLMKDNGSNNLFRTIQKQFTNVFGFTKLDVFITGTMQYVTLTSNTIHFVSFKKSANDLTRICLNLTNLNKDVCDLSEDNLEVQAKKSWHQTKLSISIKLFIFEFAIGCMILASYSGALLSALEEGLLLPDHLDHLEQYMFVAVCVTALLYFVFPTVSMSADLVICEILENTEKIFLRWHDILSTYNERLLENNLEVDTGTFKDTNQEVIQDKHKNREKKRYLNVFSLFKT